MKRIPDLSFLKNPLVADSYSPSSSLKEENDLPFIYCTENKTSVMKTFLRKYWAIAIIILVVNLLLVNGVMGQVTAGPNNASSGNNVTGVGTVAWSNPENALTNNNSYATIAVSNATSNYLQTTNYGFSIPADAIIAGIQVTIGRFESATGAGNDIRDNVVSLIKAGNIVGDNLAVTGTDWPTTETTVNYGGATNLWGTTWTPAEINASNFGVALSVNSTNNRTGSVDYMTITVTYFLATQFRSNAAAFNWNTTASWQQSTDAGSNWVTATTYPGQNPGTKNVLIRDGHTVSINLSVPNVIGSLNVGEGTSGTLSFNNDRSLDVSGNVVVAANGTFNNTNAGGGNTNTLSIGGNLTINGVFNMINSDDVTNVTFNGSSNQTISGTGATVNFNDIIINNTGTVNNNIVEITSSSFTVPAGFLTLTDGIFKISGTFTLSNTIFPAASYNIVSAAGLWINNPNVTVTGQNGSIDLDGILRISAGTYNVGNTAGNTLNMDNGSFFIMEGGIYNSTGRIQPQAGTDVYTIDISGGTITLATLVNSTGSNAIFQISNSGCTFNMSGGSIIIQNSNSSNRDYENVAGSGTITGGVVQFGNSSTPTSNDNFDIGQSGTAANHIFPSLSIVDNATSVPTVTIAATNPSITVREDLNIGAGTTFNANSRPVSVGGTFTNDGTFTTGTQTTTFNGAAAQAIDGVTVTTFSGVTINNSSVSGVTLNQAVNINGTMTLTDGIVNTSSANLLTFNAGSSVTDASDASFVNGPVAKTGTTAFTFPVGNTTGSNPNRYHPISIGVTAASNTFVAQYYRANPNSAVGGSWDGGIYGISICEYWSLLRSSGTNTANVTIEWNQYSPCNGNNYITTTLGLILAWYDATQTRWENSQGTGTSNTHAGDYSSGTLTRNSVTFAASPTVNYFTFGNTAENGSPLPVKLGPLTAFEKNNGVQIDWTAYSEENLDKYVVERSADGSRFMPVGEVDARNVTTESKYGFFDANPLPGVSFYRLRNVDIDGKNGLSNIVRINLSKSGTDLRLYPNPSTNGTISYQSTNLTKGNYAVRIFNAAGQQVYTQRVAHQGGAITQTIQLPGGLQAGLYNLRMESETTVVGTKTFMLQ